MRSKKWSLVLSELCLGSKCDIRLGSIMSSKERAADLPLQGSPLSVVCLRDRQWEGSRKTVPWKENPNTLLLQGKREKTKYKKN